jgi:hypothetical protein
MKSVALAWVRLLLGMSVVLWAQTAPSRALAAPAPAQAQIAAHHMIVAAGPDAALLGATLHSLALRARAGWSAKRLRRFAAGSIGLIVGEGRMSRRGELRRR